MSAVDAFSERLHQIRARMVAAAVRAGRDPHTIRLIAVSKGQPMEAVQEAIAAGVTTFGENYVQELMTKAAGLAPANVEWHFLGHLQRNKVKRVAPYLTCLHSLDSLPLAQMIERHAPTPLPCLIEVNVSGESTKSGVPPEAVAPLLRAIAPLARITVRGLMCIPAPDTGATAFAYLADLLTDLNRQALTPTPLTELSMGMSDDFELAIAHGATMVRIGTALFGERHQNKDNAHNPPL